MSNVLEVGEPIRLPNEVLKRFQNKETRKEMLKRVFNKAFNYFYEHFEASPNDNMKSLDKAFNNTNESNVITSDDTSIAHKLIVRKFITEEDKFMMYDLIESLMFNAISQDNVKVINISLQKAFHDESIFLFHTMLDTISVVLKAIIVDQLKKAGANCNDISNPIPDLLEMVRGKDPNFNILDLSELSTYYPKYDIRVENDRPHFYYDSGVVNFIVERINQDIERMVLLNMTLEEDYQIVRFKSCNDYYDASVCLEILDNFIQFYRDTAVHYIRGLIYDTLQQVAIKASIYLEVFNELTTVNPDPALPFCIRLNQN